MVALLERGDKRMTSPSDAGIRRHRSLSLLAAGRARFVRGSGASVLLLLHLGNDASLGILDSRRLVLGRARVSGPIPLPANQVYAAQSVCDERRACLPRRPIRRLYLLSLLAALGVTGRVR